MITSKDIEKLAGLARIHLADSEKEGLTKDISGILSYIDQIQKASVSQGNNVERQIPAHRNVMREDGEPHESGIHTETLLAEAPKRDGNYLKVKKIL